MEFYRDLPVSKMNMEKSTFVNQVTQPLEGSLRAFKYRKMTYKEYSRLSQEELMNMRLQKEKDREDYMASQEELMNKRLQILKEEETEIQAFLEETKWLIESVIGENSFDEVYEATKLKLETASGDTTRNSFRTDTYTSKWISHSIGFSDEVELNNNLEYAKELNLSDSNMYVPVVHVIEQHEIEDASTTSIDEIIEKVSISRNFMFLNDDIPVPVIMHARFSMKKKKRYKTGRNKKKKIRQNRKMKTVT